MQRSAEPQTAGAARAPGATVSAPAWLFVVSNDQKGRSYPLGAGPVTIGRGVSNHIVTADPRASRTHAEIRHQGPGPRFVLIDPGSTNGTLVNGRGVAPGEARELHDGDLIQIGAFALVFQHDAGGGAAPATQIGGAGGAGPAAAAPDVVDLRGRPAVTVGRDPTNDVVLDHPQISRHHARIALLPDGRAAVHDLNSTNGTFVDGQQLRGSAAVGAGATLTVGPFRLIYQDGLLIKGSEDGTVRIDCLRLSKTVAGGRRLLDDITFTILPREFVCLVGGSGTGKSTLLDAISGVRPANGGEVRYNGVDYYAQMDSYRSAIGYVPQDDIVPTELTVERALHYAARLRLPPDMGAAEVGARIEEVLDDLGLTSRRDVPIKNLSGGQRKRVSIGAELLSKPTIFFLDEPTSGLDPGLEGKMMALLRKLADQGRTVVLITHATQNVDLCDNIAFLAPGGHLAYYGPPAEALGYFGVAKFADIYTTIEAEPAMDVWPRRFQGSPHFAKNVGSRLAGLNGPGPNGAGPAGATHAVALAKARSRPPATRQVSAPRQFAILSQRYLETIARDRRNLLTLLIQAPIIALMIALVFRGPIFDTSDLRPPVNGTGDQGAARKLTFLLAMVAVWFGTSNSAREIVKEAAMYARERRVNLKLAPYIASKFCVLTGLSLAQNVVLLLPFVLTLGGLALLELPLLYAALVLGSVAGIGMGLAISAGAVNADRAASLVPLLLIPQVIFSGVLVDLNSNPVVKAISHFMVTKWTWRALGATVDIDAIPVAKQAVEGFPTTPDAIRQITGTNPRIFFDPAANGGAGGFFYLPGVDAEFARNPLVYLLILGLFIVLSLALVAIFQRRKDIVR